MRLCLECGLTKNDQDFCRCKWQGDGSGRSSYCKECAKQPAVKVKVVRERKLAWHYRDPKARKYHEESTEYWVDRYALRHGGRDRETVAQIATLRERTEALYATRQVWCARCQQAKTLDQFPKLKYGPLDHSEVCSDCWAVDPEAKVARQRERVRFYERAMRKGEGSPELREKYRQRREHAALMRSRPAEYSAEEWAALGKAGRIAVYAEQKGDRE